MTPFNPKNHNRQTLRLHSWDYTSPGAYFVTIVTHKRLEIFGEVINGEMKLSKAGEFGAREWKKLEWRFKGINAPNFVVMPNHIHGIIQIMSEQDKARQNPTKDINSPINVEPGSLGAIVRAYKSSVTRAVNLFNNSPGCPVFQTNYYEHIIRNINEWEEIRQYIHTNPQRWQDDSFHLLKRD